MNQPGTESKQRRPERIVMAVALVLILLLFSLFLKDILIPLLRMELHHDLNGARELLRSRGWLGFLTVILVEALQMVVVFIPAEFIQIASGLSYPFWLSLLLCDAGVCLGATIIFVLTRIFHFQSAAAEKRRRKMDRLSAGMEHKSTVLILYLLFFMPVIPFGAICFYGSGTRLPFRKYILTVAVGAIPSIVSSNLMGEAGRAFLLHSMPLWVLVLVIVVLAALLFLLIFLFLDRFCFKAEDGTPDSPVYAFLFFVTRLWQGKKQKVAISEELLGEAEAPYLMLANHESFFDFNYLHQMDHPKNPTYLVNEYYTTRPVLRFLARKAGILSKKLFTKDAGTPLSILRTIRRGYPVVIFPEGRLSPDGRGNPIAEPGGAFYQRLGVDLVLVTIHGAYFAAPKWRSRRYPARVRVQVERVLKKEELARMSAAELDALISATLFHDASEEPGGTFPQRDKAKGLENLLYACADCGALYTTKAAGNALRCTACGAVHTLDEHYRFTDGPGTISGWYDRIRAAERERLDSFSLRTPVKTKIFGGKDGKVRRETGECTLTPEAFTYRSDRTEFSIPTAGLPALAFSCGKEFELYYQGELYYFYPTEQRQQVTRWALLIDLLAERRRNAAEEGA